MKYAYFISIFVFINVTNILAQNAKLVGRQIIGTWAYEKDASDKYVFLNNVS